MDGRMLKAALAYAERLHWAVIPIHGIVNTKCSCGNPRCDSPGKHPIITEWQNKATRDAVVIRQWLQKWPWCNLGVVCGRASGIFVLDIDPRNGGSDSLYQLITEHGELPPTAMARTGGTGTHAYFAYPKDAEIPNRIGLLPGLDVKSDNGYVLLPPSLHISGKRYGWQKGHNPLEVPPSDPPEWLLQLIGVHQQGQAKPPEYWQKLVHGVQEGERNNAAAELTGHLLRHGIDPLTVVSLVYAWNITFNKPPLPEDELMRTINSISNCELKRLQKRRLS